MSTASSSALLAPSTHRAVGESPGLLPNVPTTLDLPDLTGPQRRTLGHHLPTLQSICELGPSLARSDDAGLQRWMRDLRRRALGGEPLESLAGETFALVREAARRALGLRPYDTQILAGLALTERHVVELATGEGKTLAAVAPVVLQALTGRGVHVLTFNDYLARRDHRWMGPVYERLGLTVGVVEEGSSREARRRAYQCDVVYLTAKEAGFDLLRDGLALEPDDRVQRPFHAALVDEADSLMVDEARIPLVIAGPLDEVEHDPTDLARLAAGLASERDFAVDTAERQLYLTDRGIERVEAALGCGNLFAAENTQLHAELRNALHARTLLHRDVDYLVRDGRVELVDERTGRVAEQRHWPDGLQAALEAKEGLRPHREGRILASITLQHLLRRYPRLSGMTATASPSAHELDEVYGLEVVALPTHRPCQRIDHPDRIFATAEAKERALLEEITRIHATRRPILVGTASIADSEALADQLRRQGVECRVLNARNDAEEAEIVAEAGDLDAVTISTNMAGRGTDIRLGGSEERRRDPVLALGGLMVLATQRHDSRRIDDQLRGRAGRQGDPGASRCFLALDDPLPRRAGIASWLPDGLLAGAGDQPIEQALVFREVDRAQRITEGDAGDIRRRLLETAERLERQREDLQAWRHQVLLGEVTGLLCESEVPEVRERWIALEPEVGRATLEAVERRLTLHAADRVWSEHLLEMQTLRDEIHLVALEGRDPLTEFHRAANNAFETLYERVEAQAGDWFEGLEIRPEGVDWQAAGFHPPSSTWTYLVNDDTWRSPWMQNLANRASLGFAAAIACGPILLGWALYQHAQKHLRRWLARRSET